MRPITARQALHIKLGVGGAWERECLERGTLRLGYREISHELAVRAAGEGDWDAVRAMAREQGLGRSLGAASTHVNQIRHFYASDSEVLWITFHADRLWWCFARPDVTPLPNGDRERLAIGGWSDRDIHGQPLLKARLAGKLLATQGYMGTICGVNELNYLLNKINGTVEPHVAQAQAAIEALQNALLPIIRGLRPSDLEILTDLIFRQSGWQRVGVTGGTEKDVDLDLQQPVTGERIAVQVKSRADAAVWRDYRDRFSDAAGYTRVYFVTHSPSEDLRREAEATQDDQFILWGGAELAEQAVRSGLTDWLMNKAS